MRSILQNIYGKPKGEAAFSRITAVLDDYLEKHRVGKAAAFSQSDVILITYGDTLFREGELPLQTLHRFLDEHVKKVFSGLHILPFFPYSSDDGFSVTDFIMVRPDLGSWADIRSIGGRFRLMVDLVANHVSAESRWFRNYIADRKGFEDLAIEVDPSVDLSSVTRPRSLPLLTEFKKHSGRGVHLWTTFSADQIDLNYRSLDVLENMVQAMLFYVSQGAKIIRLDAIAYLWKEIGTPCIHLKQTHDMVRLFRRILDMVAPQVALVTETNVPHKENVQYFGDGSDESQMVYNFTLPPLLLYALTVGNARVLAEWIQTLSTPSPATTFFNFTASHDGIGVRPLEGVLPPSEIDRLADRVHRNGGHVSMRRRADGTESPYEFNITYFDALKDPGVANDPFHIARFLASQAVALVLPGVPAVYIHSLLGSRNWTAGVETTGQARTINREKLSADIVATELADSRSIRARVFQSYGNMVRVRVRRPAFHPGSGTQVHHIDDRVLTVQRVCRDQTLYALTNLSAEKLTMTLPNVEHGLVLTDLLSGRRFKAEDIHMAPYEVLWLEPGSTPKLHKQHGKGYLMGY
ncbi:MAG: sugar phosphorylase [Deltaproteobacteria bacterium]|nr:MAG: sugar phosphorylase [Deltaproteobacteria bacterium]